MCHKVYFYTTFKSNLISDELLENDKGHLIILTMQFLLSCYLATEPFSH